MMNFENLDKVIFKGVGKYDIPPLPRVEEYTAEQWGRLIYWQKEKAPEKTLLHSYSYDYQFNSVWTKPEQWAERLKPFNAVLAPDFSMFINQPMSLQIYNHYRKHWVASYWLYNGINVIPSVGWSTPESYDWCFDGEPEDSVISVSSVGCLRDPECRELFLKGYNEMITRLSPRLVLLYGRAPEEIDMSKVIQIDNHIIQFHKNKEKKSNG